MVIETDADPDPTTKGPDGKVYPDLYAKTARQEHATREAIPRMLDMFDRRRIKITSMMCGLSCERNPDLAKGIAQRGHECGAHGAADNLQFQLPRDDERAFIKEAADQIEKATGQRPVGYNCRGQLRSPNTLSLAQELGLPITSTTSAATSRSLSRSTASRLLSCPIRRTSTTSAFSTITASHRALPRI